MVDVLDGDDRNLELQVDFCVSDLILSLFRIAGCLTQMNLLLLLI
jgi:hypothetical protein